MAGSRLASRDRYDQRARASNLLDITPVVDCIYIYRTILTVRASGSQGSSKDMTGHSVGQV